MNQRVKKNSNSLQDTEVFLLMNQYI